MRGPLTVLQCGCGARIYGLPAAVAATWQHDHATHRAVRARATTLHDLIGRIAR